MQFLIRRKIIFFTVVPVLLLYNLIFGAHFYFLFKNAKRKLRQAVVNDIRQEARFVNSYIQRLIDVTAMQLRIYSYFDHNNKSNLQAELTDFLINNTVVTQASYIQYESNYLWHQYTVLADGINKSEPVHHTVLEQRTIDQLVDLDEAAAVESLSMKSPDMVGFWHQPIAAIQQSNSYASKYWLICYTVPIYQDYELTAFFSITIDMGSLKRKLDEQLHTNLKISIVSHDGVYLYTDSNTPKQFNLETLHQSQYYYGTPGLWCNLKSSFSVKILFFGIIGRVINEVNIG